MNFLIAIVVIVVGFTFIIAGVTGDWRTLFTAVSGIKAPAAQTLQAQSPTGGQGAYNGVGGLQPASALGNLAGVIPAGYPHSSTGTVTV